MPRRFVLDTNVFQYGVSHPGWWDANVARFHPLSYSAVVLSELRRAARTDEAVERFATLERLAKPFVVAPSSADWLLVGSYLATLFPASRKEPSREALHFVRKQQNDALIAISAWRNGHVVVTCDSDLGRVWQFTGQSKDRLVRLPVP